MTDTNRPVPIKKWLRAHPHVIKHLDLTKQRIGTPEPTRKVYRWFHWSDRPRLYTYYWEPQMSEMRYKEVK